MNLTEDFKAIPVAITDHINTLKSSTTQNDSPNTLCHTTLVPTNSRDPPLVRGQSTKIGGVWALKHDIRSPKIYEILIKIELKGDTYMDLNNLYNHIKMCLDAVTILR